MMILGLFPIVWASLNLQYTKLNSFDFSAYISGTVHVAQIRVYSHIAFLKVDVQTNYIFWVQLSTTGASVGQLNAIQLPRLVGGNDFIIFNHPTGEYMAIPGTNIINIYKYQIRLLLDLPLVIFLLGQYLFGFLLQVPMVIHSGFCSLTTNTVWYST